MKWRELLGFLGCLLVGFACDRVGGSVAMETGAQLCKSNTDCGAAESCDVQSGTGVCKPLSYAAGGGGSPAQPGSCSSDSQCAWGWGCEYEHGQGYCKPHHDDDKDPYEADGGKDQGHPTYDSGVLEYPPCTSDSDCTAYQTCKYADDKSGHGGGDDGDHSGHGGGGDEYYDKTPPPPPHTGVCKSRSGSDDDDHY